MFECNWFSGRIVTQRSISASTSILHRVFYNTIIPFSSLLLPEWDIHQSRQSLKWQYGTRLRFKLTPEILRTDTCQCGAVYSIPFIDAFCVWLPVLYKKPAWLFLWNTLKDSFQMIRSQKFWSPPCPLILVNFIVISYSSCRFLKNVHTFSILLTYAALRYFSTFILFPTDWQSLTDKNMMQQKAMHPCKYFYIKWFCY